MATRVYIRNPWKYIDMLLERGHRYVAWDYGSARVRRIEPLKFMKAQFGAGNEFEAISVAVEGAAVYNQDSKSLDDPLAVYPCWDPSMGFDKLIDYCENPVGNDPGYYDTDYTPRQFRPVKGQPHRVVIYDFIESSGGVGGGSRTLARNIFLQLAKVAEDYPEVEFIAFGTQSYRMLFGLNYFAAIHNPDFYALRGSIILPTGSTVHYAGRDGVHPGRVPWLNSLGYRVTDMKDADKRIEYNLDSALWAGEYYMSQEIFRHKFKFDLTDEIIDAEENDEIVREVQHGFYATGGGSTPRISEALPGDGVVCDSCSLAVYCRHFREGAVCAVPSSDSAKLAKLMGSRDAEKIIDGLSVIAEIQADRIHKDLEYEDKAGERLPETDKRLKDLFDSGQKIAKLVKPELNGRGVQVNVGVGIAGGNAAITAHGTPQELIASAMRALEDRGIPREDITQEHILGLLEGMHSRNADAILEDVVDAEVVE